MPTLTIKDAFGFVTNVQLSPSGAITKYFKTLPTVTISGLNLQSQGGGKLNTIVSMQAGLDLGTTVQLGTSGTVDLEIKPKASGTISSFSSTGAKPAALFDPDQFADPVKVGANQCYISTAFDATVEADVTGKTGDLKFGFKGSSGVKLAYYQLFALNQNSPTLAEAIENTFKNFTIPGDLDDVDTMPAHSIATIEGTGDLKFSGTLNVTTLTNAPVSLSLGSVGPVQIAFGGNISVGAGFELSGEYQVRVTKLDGRRFHLGLYRKKKTEFSLTASAKGGLSAGLGQNDLFGQILQKISSDPKADQSALAGLSAARSAEIQKVVKLAVDRTLNLGVSAELGIGSESEAMFLYEIDLAAISNEGRPLVHAALDGDLIPLVSNDTPLAGIQVLKTLISSAKTLRHTLKVNLLGIYNVARVSELSLKGATAWDATTGELVITDTATASLIGIDTLNFTANSKKLRQVLAEQFLISAAYKASGAIEEPPTLHAQHTYFHHTLHLGRTQMRNDLLLSAAFHLNTKEAALARLPGGMEHFGTATVLAEAAYDNPAVEALFINNNQPRNPADYERAGRDAITYLVQKGDADDYRLMPVADNNLWAAMKEIGAVGAPQFAQLIRQYTTEDGAPHTIGVDYLNIAWWASAMHSCAQKLAAMRDFISHRPNLDPNNHDFLARKRDLGNHLRSVAATTRQDFGGPWGLIAMCLLAAPGTGVTRKILITNKVVSAVLETAASVAVAATGSL